MFLDTQVNETIVPSAAFESVSHAIFNSFRDSHTYYLDHNNNEYKQKEDALASLPIKTEKDSTEFERNAGTLDHSKPTFKCRFKKTIHQS